MKLTIAKAIAFRMQRFHGLIESFLVIYKDIKSAYNECGFDEEIILYSYSGTIYLYSNCVLCLLCCLFIALLHARSMGVLISLYLYFIFVPCFDLYFFITVVAVSLSSGFLPCKGMAVLSDTKHQAKPYSAKTFPESLPQMLHIWVFQKTFYRIAWCSDSWKPPFLYARKKAI